MQRLLETHGDDEEFSKSRLIDEDESMKQDLMTMKQVSGLTRRQSSLTSNSQSALSNSAGESQLSGSFNSQNLFATQASGGLFLALQSSLHKKNKTSFLGSNTATRDKMVSVVHKSVSLNHVVFQTTDSQTSVATTAPWNGVDRKRKRPVQTSSSLWDKVASNSFRQKKGKF